MDRRKFLIGMGALTAGGAAAIGTGAFSRVESQRMVSIEVAEDPDAYLGLSPIEGSANSENYVDLDENGHLFIDIGEHDDFTPTEFASPGLGVNSDSFTYFDDLFRICNQGKADADVWYLLPDPDEAGHSSLEGNWTAPADGYDQQVVAFYWVDEEGERHVVNEEQPVPLPLGECENIGLLTVTKGIDATEDDPLISGEVVVVADSPEAGASNGE